MIRRVVETKSRSQDLDAFAHWEDQACSVADAFSYVEDMARVNYEHFPIERGTPSDLSAIANLALTLHSRGFIMVGVLLLIATPVARVVFSVIAFVVQRADLSLWLRETLPCIFIVYDAIEERAYWIYVQAYFAALSDFDIANIGETTTIHLKQADVVTEAAIQEFARFKENVLRQTEGVIHTHG